MIPSSPRLVAFAQSECDLTTPNVGAASLYTGTCFIPVPVGEPTPDEKAPVKDTGGESTGKKTPG